MSLRILIALFVYLLVEANRPEVFGQDLLATGNATGSLAEGELNSALPRDNTNAELLLRGLILDALPTKFEDSRDWGTQAEVYDGIRLRRDPDGKLETERCWRSVNNGTWRRYSAEFVDPTTRLQVSLSDVRCEADGVAAFELTLTTPLKFHARQSEWWRGVQLYSLSLDGAATVKLTFSIQLTTTLDLTKLPPDLLLRPRISGARLELLEFKIDHVSKLGGEFAQQVTAAAQKALQEKATAEESKLVEKLNRQISRQQEKLRVSFSDAAKLPWIQRLAPALSADVQSKLQAAGQGK